MAKESLEQKRYWLNKQLNGAAAFIGVAVFFVGLRLLATLVRRPRQNLFGWNDVLIVSALFAFVAVCACAIVNACAYLAYYDTQSKAVQREHFVTIYKSSYGFSVVYPIACALPKLSICFLYLRLFGVNKWVRAITYGMIAFLVTNCIAWFVPSVFVCKPISQYWSTSGHQNRCIDYNVFGTWISLPHIVSDLVILALPLPILWSMQMKAAKKAGLFITFLAGSIGIVGACLRLGLYIHRTYVERPGTSQTTRSIAADVIVSYVEPGMYLIAACLPSLRILVTQLHSSVATGLSTLFEKRSNNTSKANNLPSTNRNESEKRLVRT